MTVRFASLAALAALAAPAAAHDWYPLACCSSQDCYPVPASDIDVTAEGYRIVSTGEVIPFSRARITPPEGGGMFHRCSALGDREGVTLGRYQDEDCFWAPGAGS